MSIDFHSQLGNTPKDGDFARYVEELVNRGRPAPGTAGYLLPQAPTAQPGSAPLPGPHPAAPGALPEPAARSMFRGGAAKPAGSSPFRKPPAGPAADAGASPGPDLVIDPRQLLATLRRKLGRLLLPLALVWLALGLGLEIPFFASSLPVGMVMLFASFYLNSTKPKQ